MKWDSTGHAFITPTCLRAGVRLKSKRAGSYRQGCVVPESTRRYGDGNPGLSVTADFTNGIIGKRLSRLIFS